MENKAGDLRVWWNRNGKSQKFNVPSVEVACGVLFGLAMSDLQNPRVAMNAGGLEVLEDIEDGTGLNWNEWYDDENGMDISEYSDEYFPRLGEIK